MDGVEAPADDDDDNVRAAGGALSDEDEDDDDVMDDDALEGEDADRLIRLRRMERELEAQYEEYRMRKDPKNALKVRQAALRRKAGVNDAVMADDEEEDDNDGGHDAKSARSQLSRDGGAKDAAVTGDARQTALWFSQPIFAKALGKLRDPGLEDADEEDEDNDDVDGREDDDEDDDDEDKEIRQMNARAQQPARRSKEAAVSRGNRRAPATQEDADDDSNDEDDGGDDDEVLSSDSAWSEDEDDYDTEESDSDDEAAADDEDDDRGRKKGDRGRQRVAKPKKTADGEIEIVPATASASASAGALPGARERVERMQPHSLFPCSAAPALMWGPCAEWWRRRGATTRRDRGAPDAAAVGARPCPARKRP